MMAEDRCSDASAQASEQPGCGDLFLVSRKDIEDVRLALLYVCAEDIHKPLAAEAERRFFAAHERLSAILKTYPQPGCASDRTASHTDPSPNTSAAEAKP